MIGSPPFVSVIIPAYNAAATIDRALRSALAQTYTPIEVIVVDDYSPDNTVEIVASYADPRVRLLRLPQNLGAGGVLNPGIDAAKGEYIAFLDADDEWLPKKLERQIPVLENNPRATMVTCGFHGISQSRTTTFDWGKPPLGFAKNEMWRAFLAATYVAKPCVVARASALRQVGPFDRELRVGEDQDMWIRLAMAGEVEFVPDLLTIVHDTPASATKIHAARTDQFMLPMIRRHIQQRRHDLSKNEIRYILGARYTRIGRTLYSNGRAAAGAALLLRAMLQRHRIGENLWYLFAASRPAQAAKRWLRGWIPLRASPFNDGRPGARR